VPDELIPLLVALALIGLGLYLNRSRIKHRAAGRHALRVERQVEELCEQGRHEAALTLLNREVDRLRRSATSDTTRLRLAHLLRLCAHHNQLIGRLDAALPYAEEAVGIVDELADRYPRHAVWPNVTLGQVLAGLDNDEAAAARLRQAYAHVRASTAHVPESDTERVIVAANLSMVLRRIDEVDEAMEVARWAIVIGQSIEPGILPSFTLAAMGWAHAALALAQTDAGRDGRQAASDAVGIWRPLVDSGVFSERQSEGLAYAFFVLAYALRPFDTAAAAEPAQWALTRFERLNAEVPRRYTRRLAEVKELLVTLTAV
jgi:tetratricopeptide (TPR) repeat protein